MVVENTLRPTFFRSIAGEAELRGRSDPFDNNLADAGFENVKGEKMPPLGFLRQGPAVNRAFLSIIFTAGFLNKLGRYAGWRFANAVWLHSHQQRKPSKHFRDG
jgi:hypothetical protein